MTARSSSLRHRVTVTGVVVVAVLVLAMDLFVYLSLRDRMLSELDRVLDARVQLVRGLQPELTPLQLAGRLREIGLRSIVRTPAGEEYLSGGAPPFAEIPAGGQEGEPLAFRTVPLDDGVEVVVLASRGGVDSTLRRLLVLEAAATAAVIGLAAVALWRLSGRILAPVADVARTAQEIAAGGGNVDRRLPHRAEDDELREMVDAFNEMLDALERALDRARESETASRRFLADAAHQLRTPAAGIRASVATMLRTADPAEREQLLDNLASETTRMARLLSSLLRVARLDVGERTVQETVDLRAVVERTLSRRRPVHPSVRFDAELPDAAPTLGDPDALEEAVDNLLDNAARHARACVVVRVSGMPEAWELSVGDDGPGVPLHEQERIFERFVSLDGGGSGLGLPIARAIVERHGGTLSYTDGEFVARLPVAS